MSARRSDRRRRRSSAVVVQRFKSKRTQRAETKNNKGSRSRRVLSSVDAYLSDHSYTSTSSRSSRSNSNSSSSSSEDDDDDNDDDNVDGENDSSSNDESNNSRRRQRGNRKKKRATKARRGSVVQAAKAAGHRRLRSEGGGRRKGFSSRGHLLPTSYVGGSSKSDSSNRDEQNPTRPTSMPTRERPDDYRVEARLEKIRSKSGGLGSHSRTGSERNLLNSYGSTRSMHSASSFREASTSGNEEDWFLERHRERREESKRDRRQGAKREARKSISRYEGYELLETNDPSHMDTMELSSLVSLLRYNRGYPIQSNYTRFEFPEGVFFSNKYSEQAATLFASILLKSNKVLKRLGFQSCFFGSNEVMMLIEACSMNTNIQLTHLILDDNAIGNGGVKAIIDYLQSPHSTALEVLRLRDTHLTDEDALLLIDAIIECGTDLPLKQLDIRGQQSYDPSVVHEMVEDMRMAGNSCQVLCLAKKKKARRSQQRQRSTNNY